jgi:lycopene beta-cyclase
MDFVAQGNTRFMYVLPTSPTEALLEYTLFSHDLGESRIRNGNKRIHRQLGITNYSITEKNKEASHDLLPVLEKNTQKY